VSFTLRPAQRDQAKPLIGLYSESGRGKTWSALLLARGFVGPQGQIGMIETESGRGEAYVGVAPVGQYLVCPIRDKFSPEAYGPALTACERGNLGALIIDSASHEWEAVGGVLDMAAQNQEAGRKGPLVWQRPKLEHSRHFVLRIMTTPIPLVIVCMRAKYPMKELVKDGKKEWTRSELLEPKQSDDILFEMFAHGWLDEGHIFHATKYPRAIPEFQNIIRDGERISIATGERLAAWSKGSAAPQATPPPTSAPAQPAGAADLTLGELRAAFKECDAQAEEDFLMVAKLESLEELPAEDYAEAKAWIDRRSTKRKKAAA
jgi:hypothetical protein